MEKQFGGEVAAAGIDERVEKLVAGERGGKAEGSSEVSQVLEGFFDHSKMSLSGRDCWKKGKTLEGLRGFGFDLRPYPHFTSSLTNEGILMGRNILTLLLELG